MKMFVGPVLFLLCCALAAGRSPPSNDAILGPPTEEHMERPGLNLLEQLASEKAKQMNPIVGSGRGKDDDKVDDENDDNEENDEDEIMDETDKRSLPPGAVKYLEDNLQRTREVPPVDDVVWPIKPQRLWPPKPRGVHQHRSVPPPKPRLFHYTFPRDVVYSALQVDEKRGQRKDRRRKVKSRAQIPKNRSRSISSRSMTSNEALNFDISGQLSPVKLTQAEKLEVVNVHNAFRRMENASNMWKAAWDESLGSLAQALADSCVFKHTNLKFADGRNVGQNIAALMGSKEPSIARVVKLFYDEKANYDMVNHKWADYSIVGHYLQVVNFDSIQVGCARNYCPELYLAVADPVVIKTNATYWVCDYWPQFNYNFRPYKPGPSCGNCRVPKGAGIGWKCAEKECEDCQIGEPDCNEVEDCDQFQADVANSADCAFMKMAGWCNSDSPYKSYGRQLCPTTCEICADEARFV